MIKTPVVMHRNTEMTVEESIVRYIVTLPDIGGYVRLIPHTMRLIGVETVNGVCSVKLSSIILTEGISKSAETAARAIAASVMDSEAVQQVIVSVDGVTYFDSNIQRIDSIVE